MKFTYLQLSELKTKCGPDGRTVMEWAAWVEYMIGPPDKYDRFVVYDRKQRMYLTSNGWCSHFDSARRFDWKETAVLITVNRKHEAIRIVDGIAESSQGVIVGAE